MKVNEESEKVGLKLNIQKTESMASGPITSWQIDGETVETVTAFILGGSKITVNGECSHEIKGPCSLGKSYDRLRQHLKKQSHYNKGPSNQSYGFSSSHVWMWELDCKESWVLKNWRLWTVVLEKTLESPLDSKESQSVHSKGNQSWIFFERADAEVETPVLWPPDAKNWLTGKDPWCWEILKAGEEDNRRWDGWMASPTQWTWVWVNPESWWWIGRPGVLRSMRSQSRTQLSDWTERNWNGLLDA